MDLTERILNFIDKHGKSDSLQLSQELKEEHQKIIGSINSIVAHSSEILHVETISQKEWNLTKEGQEIVEKGSHEANIFTAIPLEGIEQEALMKVNTKLDSSAMENFATLHVSVLIVGAECKSRIQ